MQPRGGTANCTYVTSLGRDGKFGLAVLPPGPARFGVHSRAVREPVFALELDINPGANADPRVAAIGLRGKLSVHVISLKGLDPERAFHARAYFQPAGTWMPMPAYLRAWEHPLVLVSPGARSTSSSSSPLIAPSLCMPWPGAPRWSSSPRSPCACCWGRTAPSPRLRAA